MPEIHKANSLLSIRKLIQKMYVRVCYYDYYYHCWSSIKAAFCQFLLTYVICSFQKSVITLENIISHHFLDSLQMLNLQTTRLGTSVMYTRALAADKPSNIQIQFMYLKSFIGSRVQRSLITNICCYFLPFVTQIICSVIF